MVTEKQMNSVHEHPPFNLSLRLAQTMNVIGVILMFGSAIPVLYIIGFVYAFIGFWMDKWCLLRGSLRPPSYSHGVMRLAIDLFWVACFLHVILAIWFLGQQDLFPAPWSNIMLRGAQMLIGVSSEEYDALILTYPYANLETKQVLQFPYYKARAMDAARAPNLLGMIIFILLILYVVLLILWYVILAPLLRPFLVLFKALCSRSHHRSSHTDNVTTTIQQVRQDLKQKDTAITLTYKLSDNAKYAAAYAALVDTDKEVMAGRATAKAHQEAAASTAASDKAFVDPPADSDARV